MAIVLNGFLGDAIGKLGNVVFRKWNSLITVSKYQPNVKNPNTPKQQIQRLKIKYLSLLLQPFKDSLIPLNFKNRKGLSTSWAEAIKANYPLIDETGDIEFKDLILSGGTLMPLNIVNVNYDPFINLMSVKYQLVNESVIDPDLVRLSGTGKMFLDNGFNTANICKLPVDNTFMTYIDELDMPDWPLFYNFDNAWQDGKLFYNLVKSAFTDVRAYNPRNIINQASAGSNFQLIPDEYDIDFTISERIIMPSQIHAQIIENLGTYALDVHIDPYSSIPGLNPEDKINLLYKKLYPNNNNNNDSRTFTAIEGKVTIPLQTGEETSPFMFIYLVTDPNGIFKSTVTRFDFNFPKDQTYCEFLFANNYIHPDSIKIHKPFTAIWGDLKDFIPLELIGTIPYTIQSKNEATGEERKHIINTDNIFLCSKLVRNQYYTISIMDGETTTVSFTIIGTEEDYTMTGERAAFQTLYIFKASTNLCTRIIKTNKS